jgi:hypothetical protein
MLILDEIQKTREYLDYIEEHVLNVKKAWDVLKVKCKDMQFVKSDLIRFTIDSKINWHDLSKMSEDEFIQYKKSFYPTEYEISIGKYDINDAWEHHKKNNFHHWENWTEQSRDEWPSHEIGCVEMICDWMAMGYKFGDTAKEYYEKNKDKIKIPNDMIPFMYEIFDRIEK